ncbi:hypothetical protein BKA62DRAFT_683592 [Auriculariales sp. MPI-PUGE-AT-0066]|nr:hypothetical protein BKA62DRAFT_683592 [Auriculariales sp. MPI-PUGE-AT-0066]
MHLSLVRRGIPRGVRQLHDLVGPPDPVSNLRKVVYDREAQTKTLHPYSVNEFPADSNLTSPDAARVRLDLEWNIARGRMDAFHHSFWADNNLRFHEEKAATLEAVPAPRTPAMVDAALDVFYREWTDQEHARMLIYNRAWHRANRHLLLLALRKRHDIINKAYGRFWRPAEENEPDTPAYAVELERAAELLNQQPRRQQLKPPPLPPQ